MISKVLKTVSKHNMLNSCSVLGIGISGGADSVCLAHILARNKEALGIKKIKGIHIHHGIRDVEADRDMDFVRLFCEKNGLEFVSYKADVPAEAKKTGESIEECARRLRYEFFEQSGCDAVATAHNLNDNAETVIFNLTRGASLSGLCGIPYVRGIYIRPLLDCTRNEIEEYLASNSLTYVTDSTNLCDDYTRNKIRHNILPQLFEINPAFDKAFSRCNESLRMSNEFLLSEGQNVVNASKCDGYYDCVVLNSCHTAVRYYAVSAILKENGAKNVTKEQLALVLNIVINGGSVNLCDGIIANVQQNRLFFGKIKNAEHFEFSTDSLSDIICTPIGNFYVKILLKKDLQKFNIRDMDKLIDCDKISSNVIVRNRIDGDKYKLPSRPCKTLKKLFNENKILPCKRDDMLIIADNSQIIWTEYFGTAEKFKIDNKTKKYIYIKRMGKNA